MTATSVLQEAVAGGATPGAAWASADSAGAVETGVIGHVATHDDTGRPIPVEAREAVTEHAVYDLASLTKVFTAITVLSLADAGEVGLDVPVAEWLPAYRSGPKTTVTVAHLLSHTSGLPAAWQGWRRQVRPDDRGNPCWTTRERSEVLDDILAVDLAAPPGQHVEYSCLGYVTAMAIAERVTGTSWQRLVTERLLRPLGLAGTRFTPGPERTVPTEYQPELGRGLVHGVVHDETAHALGGVSGNAGLFATVGDVLTLGRAILDGLPGVLSPAAFARLWEDQLPALLGPVAARRERSVNGFAYTLGLRVGQTTWMGERAGAARGHTGFTGTSLLVDGERGVVVALLTNRVHPTRNGPDLAPTRAALADAVLERAGGPARR